MAYEPNNPNGQATMANSQPVVLPSDQSAIPVTPSLPPNAAQETGGNLENLYNEFFDTLDNGPHTMRINIVSDDAGLFKTGDATLQNIDNQTFSTAGNTASTVTELQTLNAVDFATETSLLNVAQEGTLATRAQETGGNLDAINLNTLNTANSTNSIDTKTPALVGGRVPVDGSGVTQPVSATSLPLPTGASTEAKQDAEAVLIGAVTETAPATDTASSGLNGRLQRIAQRLTSLIALLPASIGAKLMAGSLSVTMATDQTDIPVKRRAQTDAGGVLNANSGGLVTSLVVKASAGALYKVTGWNNQAAVRYVQIFDATALPANGTIPLISYQVAGTASFELDFSIFGRPFTTGIVIATSTSATTLTVAAANILVDAQYK